MTGPGSLFARVRFILCEPKSLKTHARHLTKQSLARGINDKVIKAFDPAAWELMTAEVRTDTCKFVNSGWRTPYGPSYLWIGIGLHDAVETAIVKAGPGCGPQIVTGGPLFDRVEEVNRGLMANART